MSSVISMDKPLESFALENATSTIAKIVTNNNANNLAEVASEVILRTPTDPNGTSNDWDEHNKQVLQYGQLTIQ